MVAGVNANRRSVLRPDHDGASFALPRIAEPLVEVVQPGPTRLVALELELGGRIRNLDDAVFGQDERGAHVLDDAVADRELDHRGVLVGVAFGVFRVEGVVATHVERLTRDDIDGATELVVGRHGRRTALEVRLKVVALIAQPGARRQQRDQQHSADHVNGPLLHGRINTFRGGDDG